MLKRSKVVNCEHKIKINKYLPHKKFNLTKIEFRDKYDKNKVCVTSTSSYRSLYETRTYNCLPQFFASMACTLIKLILKPCMSNFRALPSVFFPSISHTFIDITSVVNFIPISNYISGLNN